MNQKATLLILLLVFCSCSTIQSGKYIKLREGDSVDLLANEFGVPHAAILNANRGKNFKPGNFIFVPLQRGFLAKLMSSPIFDNSFFDKDNFFKDPFLWPVSNHGEVSSAFGVERWGKVHQGIDIPAPTGTSVLAADDGEVVSTEYDGGGYGKLILVRHKNGLETLYGHLNKRLVEVGQKVYRGQIIGLVGSTGKSTGPHLHFEVRKKGDALDPFLYVSKK